MRLLRFANIPFYLTAFMECGPEMVGGRKVALRCSSARTSPTRLTMLEQSPNTARKAEVVFHE